MFHGGWFQSKYKRKCWESPHVYRRSFDLTGSHFNLLPSFSNIMGSCCACCGTYQEYTKIDDPEFRSFPILQYHKEDNSYDRQYPLSLLEPNSNATDEMRHFKMVFLGESAVGKSSIIRQRISYKFDTAHTPTTEDYFVKVHRLQIEDVQNRHNFETDENRNFHCILDIQDTAGSLGTVPDHRETFPHCI